MSSITDPMDMPNDEEHVRQLAYSLWEGDGQPEGRQDEYWYAARRQLDGDQDTPREPADPHPSDEDRKNVYNPSPGGDTAVEGKDPSLTKARRYRGSPA